MNSSPHILFVSTFETPFIRRDLEYFRLHYRVTEMIGSGAVRLLELLLAAPKADVVFSWFASTYGAAAVLRGRKRGARTIIQVGGVDVARDAQTGYGLWNSRWRGALVGKALRSADHVLVVDESLAAETKERARYDGGNIAVLPTGFSASYWTPGAERKPTVLTVAAVPDSQRVDVKGIDVLFEAALRSPEIDFILVGIQPEALRRLRVPTNVRCTGWLPQDEVRDHMRRARVYCQPSRREGLSNALCEAMLCGCIPVATDAGGARKAVGDTGFVVPVGDPAALHRALSIALSMNPESGMQARARIETLFHEKKRWDRLRVLIEEGSPRTNQTAEGK